MSEKSELPTPKKLEDARKKGQFPKSRLLTSSAVTLGGLAGLYISYESTSSRVLAWTRELWLEPVRWTPWDTAADALRLLVLASIPALSGALMASFIVSLATTGFQWNPGLVSPQLERISLFSGFKRWFSWKIWVELIKAIVVAAIIVWLVWDKVQEQAPIVLRTLSLQGAEPYLKSTSFILPFLLMCCCVLLALGIGDYFWARKAHIKELMMSRDEVKREHKDSEGDPHFKGMRQAIHRQLAASGPARGVASATAIVVNPTHIAVALRYEASEADAPYLVAKGQEADAVRIREEAVLLGIPVVRDVPLARSLVNCDVGELVPEELYQAAAAILKLAWEQRGGGENVQGGNS